MDMARKTQVILEAVLRTMICTFLPALRLPTLLVPSSEGLSLDNLILGNNA